MSELLFVDCFPAIPATSPFYSILFRNFNFKLWSDFHINIHFKMEDSLIFECELVPAAAQ